MISYNEWSQLPNQIRSRENSSSSSECCKWDIPLRSALVNTEQWQPFRDINNKYLSVFLRKNFKAILHNLHQ